MDRGAGTGAAALKFEQFATEWDIWVKLAVPAAAAAHFISLFQL
jgi:hypothetical protein